jgi:hypothetical protein
MKHTPTDAILGHEDMDSDNYLDNLPDAKLRDFKTKYAERLRDLGPVESDPALNLCMRESMALSMKKRQLNFELDAMSDGEHYAHTIELFDTAALNQVNSKFLIKRRANKQQS